MAINPIIIAALINITGSVIRSFRTNDDDSTAVLLNAYAEEAGGKIQNAIKLKTGEDVDLSFVNEYLTGENVNKIRQSAVKKIKSVFKRKSAKKDYASAILVDKNGMHLDQDVFCETLLSNFITYLAEHDKELYGKVCLAMQEYQAQGDQVDAVDDTIFEDSGESSATVDNTIFGDSESQESTHLGQDRVNPMLHMDLFGGA